MKLENFKKQNAKNVLKKSNLKCISGGEYGDVDWDFWKRYFAGTQSAHEAGITVGSAIASSVSP